MKVPLLDLKAQYETIREEVRAAVDAVFESQTFILGPEVARLEEEFARYCGARHAIGVASGTDALLIALKALGVGPGDSVVTVPYTFFATAGTIVNLGARPLFVDIQADSFNLEPIGLENFLSAECSFDTATRTAVHKASGTTVKAVVPVHLYGQCADMEEILEIGRRYHLPVVEDSCQAVGARYKGGRAGTLGQLGCFSFFPSKNLGGAGDGGMIVTQEETLARKVRLLRTHGAHPKYFHSVVGFNSRLDELQAAVLRVKLGYLDEWSRARQANAASYGAYFQEAGLAKQIMPPSRRPNREHIYHQYVIRCRRRDELRCFLQSRGIGCEIYYPLSLHEQECFRGLGYSGDAFPHSRAAAAETLALPVYPELTAGQREYVTSAIAEFYADHC